jgi:hypothetical protein
MGKRGSKDKGKGTKKYGNRRKGKK